MPQSRPTSQKSAERTSIIKLALSEFKVPGTSLKTVTICYTNATDEIFCGPGAWEKTCTARKSAQN
jgi:hypothetical protein